MGRQIRIFWKSLLGITHPALCYYIKLGKRCSSEAEAMEVRKDDLRDACELELIG